MEKTTLICFPFAGGSGYSFQPLMPYLESTLRIKVVDLPGRGRRYGEPLLYSAEAMAEDAWQQIQTWIKPPYALFGHSMGALLAYAICHRISGGSLPPPVHVFFTGRSAPSSPRKEKGQAHLFSKEALKAKLKSYGGIDDTILNNADAFDFFEPIIRADFEVVHRWEYLPQPKLNLSATVVTGLEEEIDKQQIRDWQKEFNKPIGIESLPGGHFFIFEQAEQFASIILKELA